MKIGSKILVSITGIVAAVLSLAASAPISSPCEEIKQHSITEFKLAKGRTLDFQIAEPLAGKEGRPVQGLEVIIDPKRGNCISCHKISSIEKLIDSETAESNKKYGHHGTIGRILDNISNNYTAGELRLIVVDPHRAFPNQDIGMPSFYRVDGLFNVAPACKGKTILTSQEVEDIVAYLVQLKSAEPVKK